MMENDTPSLWERVGQFIDYVLKNRDVMMQLQNASSEEVTKILHNYGFSDEDINNIENDVKTLTDEAAAVRFWI